MALDVPEPVAAYLAAEEAKDADALSRCFAEDGTVHDEGRDYRGRDSIRQWKQEMNTKYRYVLQTVHAQTHGDKVTVRARLTGEFPDNVLGALRHQHGWQINYEDPHYGKPDIVDDTAPSWLQEHPNGPRAYGVAGGAFYAKIAVDGYFPDDPIKILSALVEAYNRSGNPGRFELRTVNHDSFDIVPTPAAAGPQTPLLDTVMSFDATDTVSAPVTLRRFCEELSRRSGQTVIFGGFGSPSENRLDQARIEQHSQNQPARKIIRQMYRQVGSTDCNGPGFFPPS